MLKINEIKSPKCSEIAVMSGIVNCLCNKDFCQGNKCSSNDFYRDYKCSHCGAAGTPANTQNYTEYHCRK